MLLAIVIAQTGQARAQTLLDREVKFDIPPGSLELALLRWSAEAHVPITLDARIAAHLHSHGLVGRQRVGAALAALLRDSGLAYVTIGHTVTVTRATDPPKSPQQSASHPRPK